jgi:hypothetical protein
MRTKLRYLYELHKVKRNWKVMSVNLPPHPTYFIYKPELKINLLFGVYSVCGRVDLILVFVFQLYAISHRKLKFDFFSENGSPLKNGM